MFPVVDDDLSMLHSLALANLSLKIHESIDSEQVKQVKQVIISLNIGHVHSASMHHQTNGKSERFIQFMVNSLGTILNSSMRNWDEMLYNVLFVYRFSFSRVLSDSTFFLLYGRDAVLPQDLAIGLTNLQSDEENEDDY